MRYLQINENNVVVGISYLPELVQHERMILAEELNPMPSIGSIYNPTDGTFHKPKTTKAETKSTPSFDERINSIEENQVILLNLLPQMNQETQENLLAIMSALADLYERKDDSNMIDLFVKLVANGKRTIEDVPVEIRERVQMILEGAN